MLFHLVISARKSEAHEAEQVPQVVLNFINDHSVKEMI